LVNGGKTALLNNYKPFTDSGADYFPVIFFLPGLSRMEKSVKNMGIFTEIKKTGKK
jgi:hypothetical protein